jgi:peptidoglycan-N-acetylglucosamine deacetylase
MRALARAPLILRKVYPGALWRVRTNEKKIYLTFDDGPVPGVTPAALSVLKEFGVKATFFCVGENVQRNPDVFSQVLAEGHQVGNHTFNHADGWVTQRRKYLREVQECAALFESRLFRPPYGRLRRSQFRVLRRKFEIVMWDVLTYDFDRTLAPEHVLEIAIRNTRPGSIVVFHDSEKAKENMLWALPRYLEEMKGRGFEFCLLGQEPAI